MTMDPKDFASSFKGFMETMSAQKVTEDPPFLKRLTEHFGTSPTKFPVVTEEFKKYDHPNLHNAIDEWGKREGCSSTVFGFLNEMGGFKNPTLAELVSSGGSGLYSRGVLQEGPVQYVNIPLGDGNRLACVKLGLYLLDRGDLRIAVMLRPGEMATMKDNIYIDVMAAERAAAELFLSELSAGIRAKNVYRNHVLSIQKSDSHFGSADIKFHNLPKVEHDDIILPEGLLTRIERNTVRFGEFSKELLAAGRHLKRGMLLYGPPGTGKTLTAMYLASALKNRTILLLTGTSLGLIEQTCNLARALEPAMIVLEDVDLVAEERTRQKGGTTPLLFELLNQMDGLADDVDLIFLLTTNRADLLEPALAARPGRVDQAFEIPLPDEKCRRRLFELYSQGLTMQVKNMEPFIKRTHGASAAFICELLRKAALFAAEDGLPIVVKDKNVDDSLRELAVTGGAVTRSLLGFRGLPDKD